MTPVTNRATRVSITATSYMRRTADPSSSGSKLSKGYSESNYLNGYKHQPMSEEDNTWLREQAAAIVMPELKRVRGLFEKLCSSFTGGSHSSMRSTSVPQKAKPPCSESSDQERHHHPDARTSGGKSETEYVLPHRWDVFVSHASEDKRLR